MAVDTRSEAAGARSQLLLKVVAGPATGSLVEVGDEPIELGRAQPGPAGLGGDHELSREHARVSRFEGGRLLVEDLHSTNGTFVNGGQVVGPTVVGDGDVIWLGLTTLLVQSTGEPVPEVPPAEPPTPSAEAGFLSRIANLSNHHPKRVLGGLGIFFLIAVAIGGPVTKKLKDNQGFADRGSESFKSDQRLAKAGNAWPGPREIVLIRTGQDVNSPAVAARVKRLAAGFRRDKDVSRVLDLYNTNSSFFVSTDHTTTYLAVFFKNIPQQKREDAADRLKKRFDGPGISFGGQAVANPELREQVRMDLGKAEAIGIPLLLLASLFVFRGLVAALLPIFVGVITVFGTFLVLRIINTFVDVNVFALNIVTGLGLGLAIDYSLFIVSRYREELVKVGEGRPQNATYGASEVAYGAASGEEFAGSEAEALRRTMMTAGRTITFSATTVAVALASLIVFPQPFLYSMGIGGAVCALVAVSTALIALPALLAVLGPRVNSLSPKRWQRAAVQSASEVRGGFWYRLAQVVMRRPGFVAVLSGALMIAVGLSFFRVDFTGVNSSTLPTKLEARKVADALSNEFSADPAAGIQVLVQAPPSAGRRVAAYAQGLNRFTDVAAVFPPRNVGGNLWQVDIQPWAGGLDDRTVALVKDIRNRGSPFPIQVAGETAQFVDQTKSFGTHLPVALAILAASTLFILFVMTGSVVLPLKSLLMNLLTISATLGLLVLIFQDGRFEGLLGYDSVGAIDASQPILIAAIAFGLSTDYAVFLLGRIYEARVHGASDHDAVAIGLERTGRLVTQAALLFCIAIGVFATSQVIFIKQVGVGTAFAVLIDSTVVRGLLVPSLMAMLGARNWWAPKPLRRLHNRIGVSEA